MVKRSILELPERETRSHKAKEKKKIKPVFFDDILMETLNVTERVHCKRMVYSVRRKCTFLKLNGTIQARDNNVHFVSIVDVEVRLALSNDGLFD